MRREFFIFISVFFLGAFLANLAFLFFVTQGWTKPEDVDGMACYFLLSIVVTAWWAPLSALHESPRRSWPSLRSLALTLGISLGVGSVAALSDFLAWGEALYFSLMLLGYAAAMFLAALALRPVLGLGGTGLFVYGIAALVMTFPWYGSAFIEALPKETQPWALSYSLQISPLFIVGGSFLGKDVMVLERLYIAFPVGQQWPFVYAEPQRVAGVAWVWTGGAAALLLIRVGLDFLLGRRAQETQCLEESQ